MNIKNIIIGIAIIILTLFVVVNGINTLYKSPEFSDFCDEFKTQEIIETQERCGIVGGRWISEEMRCVTEPCPQGYCDRDFFCRQEYEEANENYYRNIFFITLPLGIIIIIVGALVFGLESVGAGLMGGGVGTILYGVGGYWRYSNDLMKFVLSLMGLIVVIIVAYWFNSRLDKHKKRKLFFR